MFADQIPQQMRTAAMPSRSSNGENAAAPMTAPILPAAADTP